MVEFATLIGGRLVDSYNHIFSAILRSQPATTNIILRAACDPAAVLRVIKLRLI